MRTTFTSVVLCLLSANILAQNTRGYGLKIPTEEQIRSAPYIPGFNLPPNRSLPTQYDLSSKMPPVGNQGVQGSCTAFAVVYAAKSYQEKRQNNWQFLESGSLRTDRICSPSYVFNTIKSAIGNFDCYTGIAFKDAFKILEDKGAAFLSYFPYDENSCDIVPNESLNTIAAKNKISSYQWVDYTNLDEVRYNISIGNPIIIGFLPCDFFQPDGFRAFQTGVHYTYTPQGMLNPANYHAMVCVGYNNQSSCFTILNSWGSDWANSGYVDVPYEWFTRLVQEAYVLNDALTPGSAISSLKPEIDTKNTSSNSLIYSSWVTEGKYREYKGFKIALTALKDSLASIAFIDNQTNETIKEVTYKNKSCPTYYYKDTRITLCLTSIGKPNNSDKGIYFNAQIDKSIDLETQKKLEKLNGLKQQEILLDKIKKEQEQYLFKKP